jgi:hypothetical protein
MCTAVDGNERSASRSPPPALPREISRVPDINKDWVGPTVGVDVLSLPAIQRFLSSAAQWLRYPGSPSRSTSIRYILLHSRSPPMCSCPVFQNLVLHAADISHLVTMFSAVCGAKSFITAFATPLYWTLTSVTSIQSTCPPLPPN